MFALDATLVDQCPLCGLQLQKSAAGLKGSNGPILVDGLLTVRSGCCATSEPYLHHCWGAEYVRFTNAEGCHS